MGVVMETKAAKSQLPPSMGADGWRKGASGFELHQQLPKRDCLSTGLQQGFLVAKS